MYSLFGGGNRAAAAYAARVFWHPIPWAYAHGYLLAPHARLNSNTQTGARSDLNRTSWLNQHHAFLFDPGEHLAVFFRAVVVPVFGGEGGVVAHGDEAPAVGAHHEEGPLGIGDVVHAGAVGKAGLDDPLGLLGQFQLFQPFQFRPVQGHPQPGTFRNFDKSIDRIEPFLDHIRLLAL